MKKSAIFILILLVIPIISAIEFDMKTNFSQGETLMAKVSGYFLEPILKENIFFYRGHVRIPMEYDITKIDKEFYIYALLTGKNPDNYSIVIKNARYMKGSRVSEEDITKNFSIIENTTDFSINPGFVITKSDYFIEVQNLQDYKITIQIKTAIKNETSEKEGFFDSLLGIGEDEEGNSTTLMSGEIKKINFEIEDIEQPTLKIVELSTENLKYVIPVYIFIEEISEKKERGFKLEPSELNISMPTNSNTTRIIYLYNTGQETLRNISLSMPDSLKSYISLSVNEIEELDENSSIKIELYIFSEEEGGIQGNIRAKTEDETLLSYSTIFLNFLKDYVPLDEDDEILITKTCSEWNGTICGKDEECEGKIEGAKDGACCFGTCKKIEESSTGKIIGWVIIIVVAGFLIWFFKKRYKGAKKPIDLLKIAKGKQSGSFNSLKTNKNKKIRNPIIGVVEKPIRQSINRPVVKIVEKPVVREIVKKVFIEKPKEAIPEYTGSSNTRTYHKTSCRFSKLIEDKYKVSKNEPEYFQKQGYKPCKVCFK